MRKLADVCIVATGKDTSTIQEVHMVIYHTLCGAVEAALFTEKSDRPAKPIKPSRTPTLDI